MSFIGDGMTLKVRGPNAEVRKVEQALRTHTIAFEGDGKDQVVDHSE